MNTFLHDYCGQPSLAGMRHRKRDKHLAVLARGLFKERAGMTPEEFLRRLPDRSMWLQDKLIAEMIVAHDPQPEKP